MTSSENTRPEKPYPVIGYTTRRHLLLDLDSVKQSKASQLIRLIQRQYPKVGDALLVQSSQGTNTISLRHYTLYPPKLIIAHSSYHAIFDNTIGYNLSCRIIHVLAGLNVLNKDYAKIRWFRGDMTLRVSPRVLYWNSKPIPEIVKYIYNPYTNRQDGMIAEYRKVLHIASRFFSTPQLNTYKLPHAPQRTHRRSRQNMVIAQQ